LNERVCNFMSVGVDGILWGQIAELEMHNASRFHHSGSSIARSLGGQASYAFVQYINTNSNSLEWTGPGVIHSALERSNS